MDALGSSSLSQAREGFRSTLQIVVRSLYFEKDVFLLMLLPEEFVGFWGRADLLTFPSSLLQNVDIPETAKFFLCSAGLPLTSPSMIGTRFTLLPLEPLPSCRYTLLIDSPCVTHNYKLFATLERNSVWLTPENHSFLAIEEGSGHIYRVGPPHTDLLELDVENENIFVNSSISQFAEFLLAHRERKSACSWHFFHGHEDSADIDILEQHLRQIDPIAMVVRENWWPMNIEYMREC